MGVNPYSRIVPIPQVVLISNVRSLSLLVFIVWMFEIFKLFGG